MTPVSRELDKVLQIAIASAYDFDAALSAARSTDDQIELLRQRFAENDLVIAVYFTSDHEGRLLPVKGGELLNDPSLIGDRRAINVAGIRCTNEDNARMLTSLARETGPASSLPRKNHALGGKPT
jgi:hypothetical protein